MDCSTDNACTLEGYCEDDVCLLGQGDNMTKKDQRVSLDVLIKLCSASVKKSSSCVKKTALVRMKMSRARLCQNNNNNTSFVSERLREAREAMRGKQRVR